MAGFDQVAQELRSFVVNDFLFGAGAELGDNDSFMEKGLIDSTGVLELVAHLEGKYGITVEDHELIPDNLDSLHALAHFVTRKVNGSLHATAGE